MIRKILNTDNYKLTMAQAVFKNFKDINVKYRFKWRNAFETIDKLNNRDKYRFIKLFTDELNKLYAIKFTPGEYDYLAGLKFKSGANLFDTDFLDFLMSFQFEPRCVQYSFDDGNLELSVKGTWLNTILFEVPILSIISECYSNVASEDMLKSINIGINRIHRKINVLRNYSDIKFTDFGTRRRFSGALQLYILKALKRELPESFVGTSNVMYSAMLGTLPIGTMAHEWLQPFQQLGELKDFQKNALETWVKTYKGELGIALSDIVGMDAFLRDFNTYFSKLYDGCRHDSGDPIVWGEKLIAHYKRLGINPKSKIAVFSDGLNFEKVIKIYKHFIGRIDMIFGVGTNLMNDTDITPPNIVLKMIECNGKPVAKISDSPGKAMCESKDYINQIKEVFNL